MVDGRSFPTTMSWLPDGRLLVAEKSGRLWIYDSIADDAPDLFADLSADVHNWWDRGLLGLAIDPGFPAQPYVYVQYTYNVAPGAVGAHPRTRTGAQRRLSGSSWCDQPEWRMCGQRSAVPTDRLRRRHRRHHGRRVRTRPDRGLVRPVPKPFRRDDSFGPDGNLYAAGGDGASFANADWGQWGLDTSGNPAPNPCGDPMGSNPPTTAEGGGRSAPRISSPPVTRPNSMAR